MKTKLEWKYKYGNWTANVGKILTLSVPYENGKFSGHVFGDAKLTLNKTFLDAEDAKIAVENLAFLLLDKAMKEIKGIKKDEK